MPCALLVDILGGQLLSGARLSGNEHMAIHCCDLQQIGFYPAYKGTLADQLLAVRKPRNDGLIFYTGMLRETIGNTPTDRGDKFLGRKELFEIVFNSRSQGGDGKGF
jgi:hypothetical protein